VKNLSNNGNKDNNREKATTVANKKAGRFGNRCAKCGGSIDEGGFCPCQTDHSAS